MRCIIVIVHCSRMKKYIVREEWNSTVQKLYSEYSREMRKHNMVLRSMTRREEIPWLKATI